MTTNRNYIEHALAGAGVTDHRGEQQVQCETCRDTFWMTTNDMVLATQVNRAILCPPCKRVAIETAFKEFLEGSA